MKKVALVTGANKGLGLETCRRLLAADYHVILGARDEKRGTEAARQLDPKGTSVAFVAIDTSDSASVHRAMKEIERRFGRLDVLVNNAGVFHRSPTNSAFEAKREELGEALETNTFGAYELCQLAIPIMKKNGFGRIVNVSSGMGQLSEMAAGYGPYRLSKTALNAVTKIFADETKGQNILVNSVCPGWVQTDMGGATAHRTIPQGAEGIFWAATLPDNGPTGGFFRDGKALDW